MSYIATSSHEHSGGGDSDGGGSQGDGTGVSWGSGDCHVGWGGFTISIASSVGNGDWCIITFGLSLACFIGVGGEGESIITARGCDPVITRRCAIEKKGSIQIGSVKVFNCGFASLIGGASEGNTISGSISRDGSKKSSECNELHL